MKVDDLSRRTPHAELWVWLFILAIHTQMMALGQANYSTPYTFLILAGGNFGTNNGVRTAAQFNSPVGLAVDSLGNIYVADNYNNMIRKVTPVGAVSTLAGSGYEGTNDGTGSAAKFFEPTGVAVDGAGNVYVADFSNCSIRKVTPQGTVTTLAGGIPGWADGTNGSAQFSQPIGIAIDTNDNVYVADNFNCIVRKITPVGTNWVVTTLAGLHNNPGSADGTNSTARFYEPCAVAVDSAGTVYVADTLNYTIRKMTQQGTNWVVTTLAGLAGSYGNEDGVGCAARFHNIDGLAVDCSGNVIAGDSGSRAIRKITATGVVTTLAGSTGSAGIVGGTGMDAGISAPFGVAVDSNNCIFAVNGDYIMKGFIATSVPAPILEVPSLSAGQFGFGITGLAGLAVNIESSTDLSNWQVVGTYVLNCGSNHFISTASSQSAQFYRVQVR